MNWHIKDILHKVGPVAGQVYGVIADLVSEEQLQKGISLVQNAATNFASTQLEERRNFVVGELMLIPGMRPSMANLITEMALQYVKKSVAAGVEAGVHAVQGQAQQ